MTLTRWEDLSIPLECFRNGHDIWTFEKNGGGSHEIRTFEITRTCFLSSACLHYLLFCNEGTKLDRGWTKLVPTKKGLSRLKLKPLYVNMLGTGLEPARPCEQEILSL